jgi:putative membrane protein
MPFLLRLLVNAFALYIATELVDGVRFEGDWLTLAGVALVFGLVNAIVKPITKFLTFPIIIVTFGLFLLVINGLMLVLTGRISEWFDLGFTVSGFRAAFLGALVVSLVNAAMNLIIGDEKKRARRHA